MAIKITVSDTVGVKVKGSINDAAGNPQPFDFSLTCKRLNTDEITIKIEGDGSVIDFMLDVTTAWQGVRGDDDKPLSYSPEALRSLCKIPGVAMVAYKAYLGQVGAKEKN